MKGRGRRLSGKPPEASASIPRRDRQAAFLAIHHPAKAPKRPATSADAHPRLAGAVKPQRGTPLVRTPGGAEQLPALPRSSGQIHDPYGSACDPEGLRSRRDRRQRCSSACRAHHAGRNLRPPLSTGSTRRTRVTRSQRGSRSSRKTPSRPPRAPRRWGPAPARPHDSFPRAGADGTATRTGRSRQASQSGIRGRNG